MYVLILCETKVLYLHLHMKKNWINFNELRQQLNFAEVLASYDVRLEAKGNGGQHVGTCPLPGHPDAKGKTFSANFERGLWQCFGCKESGNVIDLAVLMEGKDKRDGNAVRQVAALLQDRFAEKRAPEKPPMKPAEAPTYDAPQIQTIVNQPLDFELKTLDSEHPFFAERKLSTETVARFGLGFCKRGSLAGRIAVPLHDDAGQLVGYTGLALDPKSNPKYLYPSSREHDGVMHVFDSGKFLYNGFRIGKAAKDLIVVRECHTVWQLLQGGFVNVVALMGDRCSEDQAAIIPLLTTDSARIWLLTDSSPTSEDTGQSLLPQVASSRLCRWVKVMKEEEIVPDHPLLAALPKR
jgi:DNA primase